MNLAPDDEIWNASYERDSVVLYGRKSTHEVEWSDSFYLKIQDVERLPKTWQRQCRTVSSDYARCVWPEPVRKGGSRGGRLGYFYKQVFVPAGVEPLEADIHPVGRYLAEAPVQLPKSWKILFIDLETEKIVDWDYPWRSRILSFSWASSVSGRHGHVRAAGRNDAAEIDLLQTLLRIADRHDIIVSWNGSRFDAKVIQGRCEILGVPLEPDMYHWLDHLWLFKKYWLKTEDGQVKSSFALDAIGEALLNERKIQVEQLARERGWEPPADVFMWVWENAPDLLELYNNRDVELMRKIEQKTGFIALHLALCGICGVFPTERSLYPTTLIDGRMLRHGHKVGFHFPSRIRSDDIVRFRAMGAYVPAAITGLHESVAVLDFARMYPSIIRSVNISPETICDDGEIVVPETDERGRPTGRVLARYRRNPEGHIPAALADLFVARKRYSDAQKKCAVGSPEFFDFDRLSNAVKVLTNAFYGVLLSPYSRYFRRELGESVTSIGRLLTANTINHVCGVRGHRFIFGDTDSTAAVGTDDQFRALADELNKDIIPKIVDSFGGKQGEISIDYEKRYSRIVVTASKRYAGKFILYKGQPASDDVPPHVRGLEIVRSDVCRAARALQKKTVQVVLDGKSVDTVHELMESERKNFFERDLSIEEVTLSKGLSKPIDEYKGSLPQVDVAKWMLEQGLEVDVGQKIPFVMVAEGPVHPRAFVEDADASGIDRASYWDEYVWPPTERFLAAAFPDLDWTRFYCGAAKRQAVAKNQLLLFDRGPPVLRPVRKIKRSEINKALCKDRDYSPVFVEVDGEADPTIIKKLAELARAFDGPCPLELHIRYPEEVVEMKTEIRVRRPEKDQTFAQAVRAIGARFV